MGKQDFYQQRSIEEGQEAMENYEDNHYDEFNNFLFDELLITIKKIPFDNIIQNHLQYNIKEANCLFWLYTADRKLVDSTTIYSFRFANTCHPEFYRTFEIKAHYLFQIVGEIRHKYCGWYECKEHELLNRIDKYLNIK